MEQKEIKEINQHIKAGINQLSDTCVCADADNWAVNLDYDAKDVINVTTLFMHVCSNVGIKAGHISTGKVSAVYGHRLRELVKDMTGIDLPKAIREEYGKK